MAYYGMDKPYTELVLARAVLVSIIPLVLIYVGIYLHKRQPATHILAVLISHELRNVKPYALPVQVIAYSSLNESDIRSVVNGVVEAMSGLGMKVSGKKKERVVIMMMIIVLKYTGFVSNGEYNVLRAKGYTRPISVLKIKADTRRKYAKMGLKKMVDMLTPLSK